MAKMKILQPSFSVAFTLIFLIYQEEVLLIKRRFNPNKGLFNGVGGKIEPSEDPILSALREIEEETSLNCTASQLSYGGIISWNDLYRSKLGGAHLFTSQLTKKQVNQIGYDRCKEGQLFWKKISWTTNINNRQLVSNIPYFLPSLLDRTGSQFDPLRYDFTYPNPKIIREFQIIGASS